MKICSEKLCCCIKFDVTVSQGQLKSHMPTLKNLGFGEEPLSFTMTGGVIKPLPAQSKEKTKAMLCTKDLNKKKSISMYTCWLNKLYVVNYIFMYL